MFMYNKGKKILSYIFLCYTIVSMFSISFYNDVLTQTFQPIKLFPIIYFFTCLFIFSSPLISLDFSKIKYLNIPVKFPVYSISIFVFIISFISALNILSNIDSYYLNLLFSRDEVVKIYDQSRGSIGSNAGVDYIQTIFGGIRDLPQLLLAIVLTYKKRNRLIVFLLIFSLVISLFSGLLYGLRGHFIFVILSSFFIFLVFKNFIQKKLKKTIIYSGSLLFILGSLPFIIISLGRFETGYSSMTNPLYANKAYIGQSTLYFNNFSLDNNGLRNGDRTVNLFKSFFFDDVPFDWQERRAKYNYLYVNDDVFSTFIGEFVFDFGLIITFFIFLILWLLFYRNIYKNLSIISVIKYYFIWNTSIMGWTLFQYSDISGNLRVVTLLICSLIFYFSRKIVTKVNN